MVSEVGCKHWIDIGQGWIRIRCPSEQVQGRNPSHQLGCSRFEKNRLQG